MKRFIGLLFFLVCVNLYGQAPQKMSYQAVVRDGDNKLVKSAVIGMRISIIQTSVSGTVVYDEVHTPTTNDNGLVSIAVGEGIALSGSISTIAWKDGPYFLRSQIDPLGGINYTVDGTSQLLSVPYALHAGSVTNGNSLDQAYDESTPGGGRIITADKGKVEIQAQDNRGLQISADPNYTGLYVSGVTLQNQSAIYGFSSGQAVGVWGSNTGTGPSLYGWHDGAGEALLVYKDAGAGNAATIDNAGTGEGLNIFNGNPNNFSAGLFLTQAGKGDALKIDNGNTGKGLDIFCGNPVTQEAAIFARTLGLGPVAVLSTEENNLNTSNTIDVMQKGAGGAALFTIIDEPVGKVNSTPVLNVNTNGKGAGLNVAVLNAESGGDKNSEPGILSTHHGFGNAGYFSCIKSENDRATLEVFSGNKGIGLRVLSPDLSGVDGEAALKVEQEDFASVGEKGRVAHFDLSRSTTLADAAVLITSSATSGSHSALRVSAASTSNLAGVFEGDVEISSDLTVGSTMFVPVATVADLTVTTSLTAPAKAFKIDHPSKENMFLYHNSIESNERLNMYSGNITTNKKGYATVQLPDYMTDLNGHFKYQLTVMDKSFAQAVIWEQINEETNEFVIKTNQPNIQVSWQITGVRIDKWAKDNPLDVEVEK